MIGAVAKNGIEIIVKAKVTIRANIERLVGGAGEDTIIARVGEGIVTTVGSAERHDLVMKSPEAISKTVLSKVLDSGTAFEILSIDIADVDVGRNIGAQLQTDQSEADKKLRKPRQKSVVLWQLQKNKKCAQKLKKSCKHCRGRGGSSLSYGRSITKGNIRCNGLLQTKKYPC